jgi:group I intron endonuclease
MLIYLIINEANGKRYVGQTVSSLAKRWREHKREAVRNRTKSVLYKAIRRYGSASFRVRTICECSSKQELDAKESYYIKTLNTRVPNGYNLQPNT